MLCQTAISKTFRVNNLLHTFLYKKFIVTVYILFPFLHVFKEHKFVHLCTSK